MNVSFAITVHNEGEYIDDLLVELCEFIETNDTHDEIVILDDFSTDPDTVSALAAYEDVAYVHIHQHALNRDFGAQKNHLNSLCHGDYIFQIDADERVAPDFLTNLHAVLDANADVDLFFVPRINTVEGLTQAHIESWGWTVNERGWIQWPDYQTRLYKNDPDRIEWIGRVHERIVGFDKHAYLPAAEPFCILHDKTIDRQEQQNDLYSKIHN